MQWLTQDLSPSTFDDLMPRFGVRGLGLRQADVAFDKANPPSEVRLQLPPSGMVAIEVRNDDGSRASTSLPLVVAADVEESLADYADRAAPVALGLVACGRTLTVRTHPYGGIDPAARHHAGPARDGERVVLTLGWADVCAGGCVLLGRALLPDRTPARNVGLGAPGDKPGCVRGTTDDAGRFALLFPRYEVGALSNGCITITQQSPEGGGAGRSLAAVCVLPEPLRAGAVDVGDIVLEAARVLVRGHVRATSGRVKSPHVSSFDFGVGAMEIECDEDGAFEIRGITSERSLDLVVNATGCLGARLGAEVGDLACDLVLQAVGAVEATVLVDERMSGLQECLCFELVAADGRRHRARAWAEVPGWVVRWQAPPAAYRLEVHAIAGQQPIAMLSGITVEAGASTPGPWAVDLRGRLETMHLTWVDATGTPVITDGMTVLTRIARDDGELRCRDAIEVRGSGCVLLGVGERVDLLVEGHGWVGSYFGPFADAQVTLQQVAGIPVRVPDLPPAPEGTEWTIRAVARDGEGAIRWRNAEGRLRYGGRGWVFAALDATGHGTLDLAANTTYSIELLFSPGQTTSRFVALDGVPPSLTIGATRPRDLELHFSTAEMRDAVR